MFPKNHVCIVLWSGTDFSWLPDDRKDILAQQDDYLQAKVSVLAGEMKLFQRALMVVCGSAEFYGQGASWERIMRRTRTMLDLLDVARCDGYSLCKALSQFRVKSACGKTNHWYRNYTEA